MSKINTIAAALITLFASSFTLAAGTSVPDGIMFEPHIAKWSDTTTIDSSSSEFEVTYMGAHLGYKFHPNFSVGGVYDSEARNYSDFQRTSLGVNFGAYIESIGLRLTYFLKSDLTLNTGSYDSGTGLQLEAAYYTNLTGQIFFTTKIVSRSFEYTKFKPTSTNTSISQNRKDTALASLYLGLLFIF